MPPIGMEATDQGSSSLAVIPVGNAVVIGATHAGFGPGGGQVGKSQLRSQNVAFALEAMPAGVVRFSEEMVQFSKGGLCGVHGFVGEGISFSLPRNSCEFAHPYGLCHKSPPKQPARP
jgi:hypothetical protein